MNDKTSDASATGTPPNPGARADADRAQRRGRFLAELVEGRELMERVAPRRTRKARLRREQLMRTYLR